jgi:hypothetical protein
MMYHKPPSLAVTTWRNVVTIPVTAIPTINTTTTFLHVVTAREGGL